MYDQILANFGAGKFFGAFLCLLIFVGGLAAQGKLTPYLTQLSPWERTIALLFATQAGIAANSLDGGLAWYLAIGHALPPIFAVVAAHYFGTVPPPPRPPFAPSEITPVLPPRVPPLVVLAMALFVLTVLAGACSAAQMQAVVTDVTDVDKALQDGDKICVDTEVLLGVATPTEVAFACSIDAAAERALEAEIAIEAAAVAQMVAKSTASPGARAVCRP